MRVLEGGEVECDAVGDVCRGEGVDSKGQFGVGLVLSEIAAFRVIVMCELKWQLWGVC